MAKKKSEENKVIILYRTRRKPKTMETVMVEAQKYKDPSYECEKPKNPLEFTKTTWTKASAAQPLWKRTGLTPAHCSELFGEPTRLFPNVLEWVMRIPPHGEVVKVSVKRGDVEIHGFRKTKTLDRWVNRLLAS